MIKHCSFAVYSPIDIVLLDIERLTSCDMMHEDRPAIFLNPENQSCSCFVETYQVRERSRFC